MIDLQEASRDARAAALFIDLVLRTFSFFAFAAVGIGIGSVKLISLAPLSLGISIAFFALFDVALLTWRGQTCGKYIARIYVARPDGARASFGRVVVMRSFLPSILTLLPYFGFLWLFLDHLWALGPERRAVHDRLADTAVFVRQAPPRLRSPAPA
ncbi:MAG: RDD family protein [Polyangiales bacterium]